MGLFNCLEISHQINYIVECNCRKEYCKKSWKNKKENCENGSFIYPYPSRHILRRSYSVTGFINQLGGVQFRYLSTFLHYVNANVISFSYKTNSSLTRHF